ncbi:MFS transporter [Mameliella sediminis]|uniref:MFS transporter n=1 Tax=Mameliella sediminis TaxID=2836866 RepID=UPI001C4565C5|nr:MFS transporter [Mameliella sediminis]MBY6115257.1 MFS transporter [Antarctobacter heliothermus]MBY6144678.1 MFS transporter [Mameliella alba]MBV7395792.1 MFS transporter [Mameliella sediminis]MBY6160205.1 MFS transporter [Mameliella alba]MBY6168675.1 MFS transporter [Mameliella alba]
MRLVISFASLFLSVILLQLSSGSVGPLDALSGLALNFTTAQIGFLGSAHFAGFFVGCWWAPRLMGAVGHSRAFAAFTALGTIGILGHVLIDDPYAWAALRIGQGLCVAGCYTVIEAWLHAKVTNANRGRATGAYRLADITASLGAQLMISVLPPAHYVSYTLLALLCTAALLPLTLSRLSPPATPDAPRLEPRLAWQRSPLAVAGVIVAALSGSSFRMVGPLYGTGVGLETTQIAFFLASFVAGGALAQYPAGWLADRYDRRWVLIWLSIAAIGSCILTATVSGLSTTGIMLMAALFGLTTFPIFSIAAAHAHDFAVSEERIALSAALMFWFAVGAIAAPWLASLLIEWYGPPALFMMVAVGHAFLVVFGLLRMRTGRAKATSTRYIYTPRSSFLVGRLLSGSRDRDDR